MRTTAADYEGLVMNARQEGEQAYWERDVYHNQFEGVRAELAAERQKTQVGTAEMTDSATKGCGGGGTG